MTDGDAMRWYRSTAAGRVLVLAAAAFCGWSGWSYWQAGHAEPVRFAKARDTVERAGRTQIAVLNTLDPRSADVTLRSWLDATAGPLHDELRRSSAQNLRKIQQARSGATGTVTDLAVTELDTRAGTARVIATVQVSLAGAGAGAATVSGGAAGTGTGAGTGMGAATGTGSGTEEGGGPGIGHKRFTAVLTRGHEHWRLTALTAVPVGAS